MKTNDTKKTPMRKCVGCLESKPKQELIRIAGYQGQIALDPAGKAKGRGVYLCPELTCFQKARKKRALQRGLSINLTDLQEEKIFEELKEVLHYENT